MLSRRVRRILLIAAIAAPVVFAGGAFVAAEMTKSNSFCGTSCHEMASEYRTWRASTHAEVDCVRCHIPPGAWNYVKAKFFGLREVWVHVTGTSTAPVMVTRKIPNVVCSRCHPSKKLSPAITLAKWTTDFKHTTHVEGALCIDCHARVVHTDVSGVPANPPKKMKACFTCHDGKSQPNECAYCHATTSHPDRGPCAKCHGLKSWKISLTHPDPLVGRHKKILCERCHAKSPPTDIGPAVGCIDCHQPLHPLDVGALNLRTCADCHVIVHWKPNTFDHPERKADCASCHTPPHPDRGACTNCHGLKSWASGFDQPAKIKDTHKTIVCER